MMRIAASIVLLSSLGVSLPALAGPADRNDDAPRKPRFVILEDPYETERLTVSVGADGLGTVRVPRACEGCGEANLKVTGSTRLLVRGKQRPLRELASLANRGATVFAKAKTDQAVRIEVY